jgi:hypothetical protein
MKGEVKKTDEGLVVKFEEIANVKNALKEGIALCMQGNCECKTEAYQHVERIDMVEDEDSISVNLKGKNIPKDDVEKCIQFYKKKLSD